MDRHENDMDRHNLKIAIQIPGEGFINWDRYQWLMAQRQQIPGGTSRTNSVDALLRPEHITINDSGDQTQLALDYTYDNASNITQRQRTIYGVIEQQSSSTYGYDGEYRLTSDNRTTQIKHYDPRQNQNDTTLSDTHTYQYDGVGNRTALNRTQSNTTEASSSTTAITASVDNNNRLTQRASDTSQTTNGITTNENTSITYTHDANGHTTSKTATTTDGQGTTLSTKTTTYTYDTAQRLVKVSITTTPAGQGATTQTTAYAYNPYGQRIRKISHTDTAQASTVYYLYTQQGLVGEYDDQGNLLVEYHYRPNSPWMTNPIYQKRDGQYYYYFNDHLGTPQQLYARSGKLVWEATYDTFGLAHINESKTTIENNLRFPGQYYDTETQLHHNYFRDYDPQTGRYIQSDPIGLDGGINTFVYVGGNPNRGIDPWGLVCVGYPQRVYDNFVRTNQLVPGVLAPIGLGLFTAGKTAELVRGVTIGQWILGGFRGMAMSGISFTSLETAVVAGGVGAMNFLFVSAAFEGGVLVGSMIVAALESCPDEPDDLECSK